jgi:hypothetical protein
MVQYRENCQFCNRPIYVSSWDKDDLLITVAHHECFKKYVNLDDHSESVKKEIIKRINARDEVVEIIQHAKEVFKQMPSQWGTDRCPCSQDRANLEIVALDSGQLVKCNHCGRELTRKEVDFWVSKGVIGGDFIN